MAQQLTLLGDQAGGNLSATHGYEPLLTPRMVNLLNGALTHDDCKKLPVLSGEDRATVMEEIAAMGQVMAAASGEAIAKAIVPLFEMPRRRQNDEEAQFSVSIYQRALNDLPVWAIIRAVDEIIREDDWFPQASRIRRCASGHMRKALWRRYQLKMWLERSAARTAITSDGPPITDAEIVAMPPHIIKMGIPKFFDLERVTHAFEVTKTPLPEELYA